MKNIYKPLILGITLAMAVSSNANAKQSLVKNVVKHASPKQQAGHDSDKADKHIEKQAPAKLHGAKLVQVNITKNIVKQVAVKNHKPIEVAAKADKNVTKQILSKHQEQLHKLTHAEKHQAVAEPVKQLVEVSSKFRPKIERKLVSIPHSIQKNGHSERPIQDVVQQVSSSEDSKLDLDNGYTLFNADTKSEMPPPLPSVFGKHRTTLYKIKRGDTIPSIFQALNLNTYDLHKVVHSRKLNRQFKYLTPGKTLSINTNARGELTSLAYKSDSITDFVDTASNANATDQMGHGDTLESNVPSETATATALGQIKHVSAHVLIQSSLEHAAKNAGLPKKITKQLTDIFAWDIDFSQNLRPNDQFTVVYEKVFENGRAIDTGDIVAAEFVNQGERHQAVRYKDDNGVVSYYTPEGEGMRRAFLRNPVDFARVSSFFNPARRHPVLNRIRAHKGVDYAASTGTPIKTTGDGRVAYKGVKGGYGRVVMIEHGNEYMTLYAHLSDYADVNEGDSVKQGQVIGFVGESGLATGPHLHYEFLVNGVHKDPLTVSLPHSLPINRSLLSYFKTQTHPLLAQLDQAKTTMLARNTIPDTEE